MFFSSPTSEQATALAAVFHACEMVSRLANTGEVLNKDMSVCMGALLKSNSTVRPKDFSKGWTL
jgi:high frequency lysogenization protein